MKRRLTFGMMAIAAVAIAVLVLSSPAGAEKIATDAKTAATIERPAVHLMDGGAPEGGGENPEPSNTINPPNATPLMPADDYLWYGTGTAMAGGFMGNCFDSSDIPTSWWPMFRITGMWVNQAQGTGQPNSVNTLALGKVGGGAWPATGTVTTVFNTVAFGASPYATGLIGGRSMWGWTGSGGYSMVAGDRVAAGLLILQAWGNQIGLKAGDGQNNYCTFIVTPVFGSTKIRPNTPWMAGIGYDIMAGVYVSGATVPVELQSFHVN